MAGTVNAGSIIYEVDMDTAKLLQARRDIDAALNGMGGNMGRLEANVNRTERAADSASRSMSKLGAVASGLVAALSIQQVGAYADAWTVLNNKVANSVKQGEQQAEVMQRVFDISQATQSSLNGTATLYARLERGTRLLNTSSADLAKLTTIINQGFAISGATTQEAENAIVQLSQGLAAGALRGEEFNSVSEQGSRLMIALADSLGVSLGELRAMAAQGKLTNEVIVNGLLSQGDAIGKEFAKTTVTISQGLLVAGNNITKFFGENSTVKAFSAAFRDSVIAISSNMDLLSSALMAAAAIMGGRFAGALAMSVKGRVSDAIAARAQSVATADAAAATANAAKVITIKAGLDKEMALSNLAVAQTEYAVARGSAAEALALDNLIAVKSVAIQRSATYAEAQLAEAAATRAAAAASAAATTTIGGLARNALALIGGPVGFAVIAAAGIFYFYQKMQQAKQESIDFADKLDGVISKMKTMGQVQLAAEIDSANKSIKVQSEELSKNEASLALLNTQIEKGKTSLKSLGKDNILYYDALVNVNGLESKSIQLTAQVEDQRNKLSQTISKTGILQAQMNGTFVQGIDLLKRDGHEAGVAAGLINQLGNAIDFAGRTKEKFNSTSLQIPRSQKADDYNKDLENENTLLAITDKRLRAVTKARMEAAAKDGNQNQINTAGELAGAQYDLQAAEAARNSTAKASTKVESQAEQAEKRRLKSLSDLNNEMAVAELKYRGLNREAAQLAAVQDLGVGATVSQVEQASKQAGEIFDIQQRSVDKKAALEQDSFENAERQRRQDLLQVQRQLVAGDISFEQSQKRRAEIAAIYAQQIAQANSARAITPQQSAAGTVDPVQELANENARKLALIQQFEDKSTLTHERALELRNAAEKQFEQQRIAAQWEIWRNQSTGNEALAASFDALAGNASNALTGMITGSMSASEAMRSLGSTVLNSLVNTFVQMGVEWVKSAVMGAAAQNAAVATTTATQIGGIAATTAASTTAAGATLAAWLPAALVASIGSFGAAAVVGGAALLAGFGLISALSGKRKNGGPVSAGSMYQVGEGGMPEIYQASNGSQYMIPGDNGKVISNKDIGGSGGGITIINNVENYSSGAMVDTQASSDGNGNVTIQTIVTDIANGGQIGNAIATYHNAPRRARGG
nr:tape measure protein [uncultured Erwinia sp.]